MSNHPVNESCRQRLAELERRMGLTEANAPRVLEKLGELGSQIAALRGSVAGYLVAGGVLAAGLSALASVVVKVVMK